MTPLQIEILLHYHYSSTDYPNFAPSVKSEELAYFLENGYLEDNGECQLKNAQRYSPTEKLHVYCDALCNMPEPKQIWVVNS